MSILAGLTAFVELLKKAGVLRDRQQEADTQAQFLATTSGPLYALARIGIIYFAGWDIFFNKGQAWREAGLPPVMEALILIWLFIGPAILPFAEAALKAKSVVKPDTHVVVPPTPERPDRE